VGDFVCVKWFTSGVVEPAFVTRGCQPASGKRSGWHAWFGLAALGGRGFSADRSECGMGGCVARASEFYCVGGREQAVADGYLVRGDASTESGCLTRCVKTMAGRAGGVGVNRARACGRVRILNGAGVGCECRLLASSHRVGRCGRWGASGGGRLGPTEDRRAHGANATGASRCTRERGE